MVVQSNPKTTYLAASRSPNYNQESRIIRKGEQIANPTATSQRRAKNKSNKKGTKLKCIGVVLPCWTKDREEYQDSVYEQGWGDGLQM